jgi:HEAT repeat protein
MSMESTRHGSDAGDDVPSPRRRSPIPSILVPLLALFLLFPLPARCSDVDDLLLQLRETSALRRFAAVEGLGRLRTPEAVQALIRLTADEPHAWLAVRQLVSLKGLAVPYLMDALASGDPAVVRHAIYALGELRVKDAVPPILGFLRNPDPEIRQNAVFALGSIKDARAVDHLLERLRDQDNVVREYAAAALENIGDPRVVPQLREAVKSEQGSIFNMAAALYNLGGEDAIDILIGKLRDPNSTNRLYAVYALGKIRDSREVEPLIESLDDENVQWLAAKALINLGEMAVPALSRALGRKERGIRLYSAYALGEIGIRATSTSLLEYVIDPDPGMREFVGDALVKLHDHGTIPRLLYFLEKGDPSIQSQILKILGYLGEVSTGRSIRPLLRSPEAQVRANAAFALGELRDPGAVGDLMALFEDPASLVSATAAAALVKMGRAVVPVLLEALPGSRGQRARHLIQVLGKLKAPEAVEPIMARLADMDPVVRRASTVALTEIANPKAEESLVMLLTDSDSQVRMYASVGLMQFGGRLSVRLLLYSLRSEETRWLAVRILDRIGPRGVNELIEALKDPNLQGYATDTLIKLDGQVLPQLERALRSDEENIRNNIAYILGEVKDPRAVTALMDALRDETRLVSLAAASLVNIGDPTVVDPLIQCLTHPNEQVRLYSAYALGNLRDPRAVDPLLELLRDADGAVRGIAAYSLGMLRSRKATQPLLESLDDTDEGVRLSAAVALGRLRDGQALPALREKVARDPSPNVRKAAQESVQQILYQ